MSDRARLTERQKELLSSAVTSEYPELEPLLGRGEPTELPLDDRNNLRMAIVRAQLATGFADADQEQLNAHGRELNAIIHALGP